MYPHGRPATIVTAGPLGDDLEGAVRPGHFDGVLTVVLKLLNLTGPQIAYFGEKDYQQLTLIRQMVTDLDLDIRIAPVPTVREDDGLARSSRNRYLTDVERAGALAISRALRAGATAGPLGAEAVLAGREGHPGCGARPGRGLRCAARPRSWPRTRARRDPPAGSCESRNHAAHRQPARAPRYPRPELKGLATVFRTMLKSKIHRATVTQADLHYVGSITIDEDLLDAADLLAGEQVAIVDIDNGARLETYVIPGPRGTGIIGINGAAARLVQPGDLVIIISYMGVSDREARELKPKVVHVDGRNQIVHIDGDPAAPVPGDGDDRGDVRGDVLQPVVMNRHATPPCASDSPGRPS